MKGHKHNLQIHVPVVRDGIYMIIMGMSVNSLASGNEIRLGARNLRGLKTKAENK